MRHDKFRGTDCPNSPKGWHDAMVGVEAEIELARLRRELERFRAENARLARLLDLRGQDTAPAPEQMASRSRRAW